MNLPSFPISRGLRLTLLALLVGCGGGTSPAPDPPMDPPPPAPAPVASVHVQPAELTLDPGATQTLSAVPRSATGQALTDRSVTWSSADDAVASVTAGGVVTAHQEGSVEIRATSEGVRGSATVTVRPPAVAVVDVTPAADTVVAGQGTDFAALARDAGGTALAGRATTWRSESTAVATIDGSGRALGVAPGSTAVVAAVDGVEGSATLTVLAPPVAVVEVSPAGDTVTVGDTVRFSAEVRDATGGVLADRRVTWSTSDSARARVDSTGAVAARAPGEVTVTATAEGVEGTASLLITAVPVASLTVTPAAATALPGAVVAFSATLRDAQGAVLTGRSVAWSSSDPTVATVDGVGQATAVAPGTATVSATAEGVTGSGRLTVQAPPPPPPAGGDSLIVVAGDGASALSGVPLADSLVVRLVDATGQPRSGATVTWSVSAGSGTLLTATSTTDGQGRAMALVVPGTGASTVQASVAGVSPVTLTITGTTAGPATTYTGRNGYVEYRAGTLPLILLAPHGGTLEPGEIPARAGGTQVRDFATDDLAFRMAAALEARTGQRPHLVVFHLSRTRVDANREIVEAAEGHPLGEHAWREFQGLADHARRRVEAGQGSGFVVDIHGHGHAVQRLELGYLLDDDDLRLADGDLDGRVGSSSLIAVAARTGTPVSVLLRGPASLGAGFHGAGYPSVPSPADPAPGVGEPYFTGGYNTRTWGSRNGGSVDAVQLEANMSGVRDSAASRAAFAAAAAAVLEAFLVQWYGWTP